jgi:hypothetical protein
MPYSIFRFLLLTLVVSFLFSCRSTTEKPETSFDIYQSYQSDGVASFFSIPPGLVSIFLTDDKAGNAELKELLSDTKQLSFLVIQNNSEVKENSHYSELNQRLNAINFKDLAVINSGNEIVIVKVVHDDESDKVREMVVIVSNYETLFCVSFKGNVSLNSIANLTKPENMEALSNLKRIKR